MHTLATPFRIARYPITHRQFQAFVDAGGYGQEEWWTGLVQRPDPIPARWTEPNAPRESVSWYEATAFCRWLDAQLDAAGALPAAGWRVCLPTEEQWERAGRGTDDREYPWGKDFRSGYANIDETRGDGKLCLNRTSPVGLYPLGKAPSGALDMAGNVWEWCRNEHKQAERVANEGDRPRVVRGGSWVSDSVDCRSAYRLRRNPDNRFNGLGFRVCCAPSIYPCP